MTDQFNHSDPATPTAEPVPDRERPRNGAGARKTKRADPLPGISVRELVAERNWTALGGLGLIVLGVLTLFGDMFGLHISLWAVLLLGVGTWLMFDGWQQYQAAGQVWVGKSQNRVIGGGVVALVGLLDLLRLNWWGMLLIGVGVWLAYTTWQGVEADGGAWTDRARHRLWAAALIGIIGLFSFFNLGSAWPWLLILGGGFMLYRRFGGHSRC
jgi:hypothetical protein